MFEYTSELLKYMKYMKAASHKKKIPFLNFIIFLGLFLLRYAIYTVGTLAKITCLHLGESFPTKGRLQSLGLLEVHINQRNLGLRNKKDRAI